MIRRFSEGFKKHAVHGFHVVKEPELYPKELVDALNRLYEYEMAIAKGQPVDKLSISDITSTDGMFSIEGYIIESSGIVGIHPNAPDEVKEEWMVYWRSRKEHPK